MVYQINISECYRCFDNCHQQVLRYFGGINNILKLCEEKNKSHFDIMIDCWKQNYNVLPIRSKAGAFFDKLEFVSEQHYILWKLKYSET
jgi:hypothetical protein